MTRRGIKQEKLQAEDIEEVVMPSSMKPKRKARADVNDVDLEMLEAPSQLAHFRLCQPRQASQMTVRQERPPTADNKAPVLVSRISQKI